MRCTIAMRFVDTNVLLYSVSTDPAEAGKAAAAVGLLADEDLCLSVQVLQEFYVQATRLTRADPLPHDDAVAFIDTWQRFRVQEMSVALMLEALAAARRWRVSYWDAAIVEAARILDCDELLTEDLNAGQVFDGVKVVNPFA
jgi:predicted nucleic acid-binding protein